MKTQFKRIGDTIIVSLAGRMDFENQVPLRDELEKLIDRAKTDSVPKKIIFNLENLDFVGSSGISSFVQTLKNFNGSVEMRPRYCNVKSEFRRFMKAFDESGIFDFYDNEDRARQSFDN